ncbi:MAG TPA: SPFH domain-containing protein [Candidatus Limnocylindria bacterium]|jgi:regulator of protease activity HflC (stomatin/prohibitin superfamily)|nr:SPFH domain-containing protein [Candidatus Limnocylindria bacterium]
MIDNLILLGAIGVPCAIVGLFAAGAYRREFTVPEGYAGLLYRHGHFARVLPSGWHLRWGDGWTLESQDLREMPLVIAGYEVLTRDDVPIRVSLVLTYRVSDPAKAITEVQNWHGELLHYVQLALRSAVSELPSEAALGAPVGLGLHVFERLQSATLKIGVTAQAIEVKGVDLPITLQGRDAD